MTLLLRWVIASAALYAAVWLLAAMGLARPQAENWYSWGVAGACMGLVNAVIRPVLRMLTAPLNCLTLGLVGGLINVLLFLLIGWLSRAVGFPVFETGFWGAVVGALLVSVLFHLGDSLIPSGDGEASKRAPRETR